MQGFPHFSIAVILGVALTAPALVGAESDKLPEIVARTRAAVVTVIEKGSTQVNGFVVAETGRIVTLGPVLSNVERISVTFANGRTVKAEKVNQGETTNLPFGNGAFVINNGEPTKRGLGLITVEAEGLSAVEIGDGWNVRIGEKVFVIGNDAEHRAILREGVISSVKDSPWPPYRTITAKVDRALVGAPVLNSDGKVIGVACVGTPKGGERQSFFLPLKPSDAHQFSLGNVKELDADAARSWLEELDELSADKEFIRRKRERVEAMGLKVADRDLQSSLHDEALSKEDWEWLAARHPKNSSVWWKMARAPLPNQQVHMGKKDALETALPLLRKAVELNPDNEQAWSDIATAASKLGRPAEVIEARKSIVRISPQDASDWNRLGSELLDQGMVSEAESAFRKGLELSSDAGEKTVSDAWGELCWNFVKLLTRANRSDEALEIGELAVRLNSTYTTGFSFKQEREPHPGDEAVTLALDGKTDEAITKLRSVLTSREAEDHRFAYYNLGVLYLRAAEYARAVTAFDSAYRQAKDDNESNSIMVAKVSLLGWCVAKSKLGESKAAKERLAREFAH